MSLIPSQDYFRNNVALRNDTILGVCEALGQDLRINPMFLRVPLASGIIFAPALMVSIYLALGVLVFVSRTFLPTKVQRAPQAEVVAATVPPQAHNQQMELPRAA